MRQFTKYPVTAASKPHNRLDSYIDKYGLEFVFMVGRLFDRHLDADLDEEPYHTKIVESGCSLDELKEIAKYLHNNISISVSENGVYYIWPRRSYSANSYKLPYKEYNQWLGISTKPRVSLGRLGQVELPFDD